MSHSSRRLICPQELWEHSSEEVIFEQDLNLRRSEPWKDGVQEQGTAEGQQGGHVAGTDRRGGARPLCARGGVEPGWQSAGAFVLMTHSGRAFERE